MGVGAGPLPRKGNFCFNESGEMKISFITKELVNFILLNKNQKYMIKICAAD
jgi:hypothetical protein